MSLAAKLPYDHAFAGGFPGIGSQPLPTDSDCLTYLAAVKAADGAGVEVGVAVAVDEFVKGCKADSAGYAGDPTRTVWDAMKSACIMCGARTLSGALVSLRQYGPELWDSSVTPTITDSPGSAGEWNADTLTMTSPSGELVYFPVFTFGSIAATAGVQYRISGRFVGDYSHVSRISFGGAVKNSPATSQDFSFTLTAVSSASFAINLRGTDAPSSVRIESLSIREVIDAPTNVANGFVSGDYSRTAGLTGDGTSYLDSGRANNADPQNDNHMCVYATAAPTGATATECLIGNGSGSVSGSHAGRWGGSPTQFSRSMSTTLSGVSEPYDSTGLIGISRNASNSYTHRANGSSQSIGITSGTPYSGNSFVFARNSGSVELQATATLAFYSIGTSLDLAKMDSHITAYVTAIGAAI